MRRGIASLLCAAASFTILDSAVIARDLTLGERIRAQEAIGKARTTTSCCRGACSCRL